MQTIWSLPVPERIQSDGPKSCKRLRAVFLLLFMRKTHFALTDVSSKIAILGVRKGGNHRDQISYVPMRDGL